jgi:hypothetical protein
MLRQTNRLVMLPAGVLPAEKFSKNWQFIG